MGNFNFLEFVRVVVVRDSRRMPIREKIAYALHLGAGADSFLAKHSVLHWIIIIDCMQKNLVLSPRESLVMHLELSISNNNFFMA